MKKFILLLMAIGLPGCQTLDIAEQLNGNCRISQTQMQNLIKLEWHYLQASSEDQRAIRALLQEQQDNIGLALILSQPDSTREVLQRSAERFEDLQLDRASDCSGERYLILRQQQTASLLALKSRLRNSVAQSGTLQQENAVLRQQIDALTEIERDISIQKDGEEK